MFPQFNVSSNKRDEERGGRKESERRGTRFLCSNFTFSDNNLFEF